MPLFHPRSPRLWVTDASADCWEETPVRRTSPAACLGLWWAQLSDTRKSRANYSYEGTSGAALHPGCAGGMRGPGVLSSFLTLTTPPICSSLYPVFLCRRVRLQRLQDLWQPSGLRFMWALNLTAASEGGWSPQEPRCGLLSAGAPGGRSHVLALLLWPEQT